MVKVGKVRATREPAMLYRRIEIKLGVSPLRSDRDLSQLVDERLPLACLESLSNHGLSDDEIYSFISPALATRRGMKRIKYVGRVSNL